MSVLFVRRRVLCGLHNIHSRALSKVPVNEASLRTEESASPSSSVSIDEETIKHLERISLVDFANKRGIERLVEAIKFADKLNAVDTTGVEPLVSVLENEVLHLRKDEVTEENDIRQVMATASVKEEDYYVAPPGNIPLVTRDPADLRMRS